eukprot:CAMPEP_0174733442 /NCGR_PEP_ID=MMETSP1094-20130205/61318_1 /TAXON_ID=156173 /ORGANISM="Chrysochromulina brevifilum, Strain UTEX LB 985" /LENGTH=52 /DNA_ID=CAMNT_0015936099 /DNA_START=385 /DNA_END=539 /DNA_ORIENTATION=+
MASILVHSAVDPREPTVSKTVSQPQAVVTGGDGGGGEGDGGGESGEGGGERG